MNAYIYLGVMLGIILISAIVSFFMSRKAYKEKYARIGLDIEVEDMMKAENEIDKFYKNQKLTVGASIKQISDVLKVKDGGIRKDIEGQARLSAPDKEGYRTVEYKEHLAKSEKLFVFAHECAHVINGDNTAHRPKGYNKSMEEQYIDYMAAALLMPYGEILKYLKNNSYSDVPKKTKVKLIYQLSDLYSVSEVVALRRVQEVIALDEVNYLPGQ